MSPQNCLAILSPFSIGSSPRRRRSDEGRGVKGESERDTSDACSALDIRGAGKCGERGKAFGDLTPSDEALAAQDERAGESGAGARESGKARAQQDSFREDKEGDRIGAGSVSGVKRHALDGEAQGERRDKFIPSHGAGDFASGGDRSG